jgi:UDP-3-O-[3-hydroxymyristoyl] glucosamine N-acyltransferase
MSGSDVAHVAAGADLADDVALGPGAVIEDGVRVGAGVRIGPHAVIEEGAVIGDGVRIGAGSVIRAGTDVGERCLIEENVLLGKLPRLRPGSSAAGEVRGPLVLEREVIVCCGAVVYASSRIGAGAIIGDQSQVRERSTIGPGSVLGRGSSIDFDCTVGARVLIQSGVYVTGGSVVEDDVFLAPGVLTTNDNAMGRHGPHEPLRGAVFRRACRVGGGVILVPGVVVGEEAFIAAGAVVTRDVGDREVVVGVPGRVVRSVGDEDLLERWS